MNSTKRNKNGFNFKKEPQKALFTILGIIAILVGIFIVIPVLLPLFKLVLGIILIIAGYVLVNKNSGLFQF